MFVEFVLIDVRVSNKGEVRNFLAVPFFHPIQNHYSVRPRFRLGFDLNIKESLFAKPRQQILPAFLDQFRRQTILLIYRKQLSLRPRPKVRTFDRGVNRWSRYDLEMNVRAIGVLIVIGTDESHLSSEMILVL